MVEGADVSPDQRFAAVVARITPEWLLARCTEDGDCWLWNHARGEAGCPKYGTRVEGEAVNVHLRRPVWQMANPGKSIGNRMVSPSCGNPTCLNPDHLVLRTKGQVLREMMARPDVRARRSVASMRHRNRNAKLDMEKARYIRSSDKTLVQLGAELGVSLETVSRVRRGVAWQEGANPFAGLLASNDSARRAA